MTHLRNVGLSIKSMISKETTDAIENLRKHIVKGCLDRPCHMKDTDILSARMCCDADSGRKFSCPHGTCVHMQDLASQSNSTFLSIYRFALEIICPYAQSVLSVQQESGT